MNGDLKQEFQEHLAELKQFCHTTLRFVPWIIAAVFLLAAIGGFALYSAAPEQAEEIINYFAEVVDQAGVISEEGGIRLFPLMFNNWRAMLFCILFGFIPFLFVPISAAISNAAIMGVLAGHYYHTGQSMAMFFASILPHGIFEIPALILSVSLGTILCIYVVLALFRHKKAIPMLDLLTNILRTLLLVIFPLIVISAVIETYITPLIMQLFL